MGKLAFAFSGQGAQKKGMGHSFYENNATVKNLFYEAVQYRPNTAQQCFFGTDEELKETANTQPCLYLANLAGAIALKEAGIVPDALVGFSLGELSALAFANVYDAIDGFQLVCKRGLYMQEGAERSESTMMAVMKMNHGDVEKLCEQFQAVYPVNYNAPSQLVVAGAKAEMELFKAEVKACGGRTMTLPVSGGFHSPFMNEANEKFVAELEKCNMRKTEITVYSNYTAMPYGNNIMGLLGKQMNHALRFQQSIENMIADGVDTFIEVGAGDTLRKLIRRIDETVTVYGAETMEEVEELKKILL